MPATEYNGWKNRQTWNVALWVQNDEALYGDAVAYATIRRQKGRRVSYTGFARFSALTNARTPDGISYTGTRLDYAALSEMLREMVD